MVLNQQLVHHFLRYLVAFSFVRLNRLRVFANRTTNKQSNGSSQQICYLIKTIVTG